LADSSAGCLIEVLLAEDPSASVAKLDTALRLDPALTLWGICQLQLPGEHESGETIRLLAARIASCLPHCLATIDWQGESEQDHSRWANRCSELAAQSVSIATRVARTATAGGSAVEPENAYLLGLLHNLPAWLAVGESDQGTGPIAVSMARSADEIRSAGKPFLDWDRVGGTAAAECVSDALSSQQSPSDDEAQAVRAAERWWQGRVPLADQLPLVAQRMARLEQLESRFGTTLEDEKLQAMYKLAAGAGHEINNPLGSIAGRAQLLLRDETDPERRRTLAKINSQAFRAHEMISDMMLFARPPALDRQRLDPAKLIDDVVAEMQEDADQRRTEIVRGRIDSPGGVEADATQLTVTLRAMCLNALEAIGEGGRIVLSARQVAGDGDGAARVEIMVSDNGPGLSAEQRRHLFDPFYSGREAGRGLGFGLSKCWRIVRNHGGTIDVDSTLGHGATFRILLPAA